MFKSMNSTTNYDNQNRCKVKSVHDVVALKSVHDVLALNSYELRSDLDRRS